MINSNFTEINKLCFDSKTFVKNFPEFKQNTLGNRFSNQTPIGQGSFGRVIKVKLQKNNLDLVIKEIYIESQRDIDDIAEEIRVLKKIEKNPYLLNFYFCVIHPNTRKAYIFTELLSQDLSDSRNFRKKPQGEKLEFYLHLTKAIKELNNLNYVHNDIKPANIMLKDKSYTSAKLIDFGLSTKIGSKTDGGSPIYMPIEKIEGNQISDPQMDIVSLGVTIAAMEMGENRVLGVFDDKWGITISRVWNFFHRDLAKIVGKKYPVDIVKLEAKEKILRCVKGVFENNFRERIYSFEDFMNGLMENDLEKRLNIDDAIFFLEKFYELYKIDNEVLNESNQLGEVDSPELDNGDLEFLGQSQHVGAAQNFEDIITQKYTEAKNKLLI